MSIIIKQTLELKDAEGYILNEDINIGSSTLLCKGVTLTKSICGTLKGMGVATLKVKESPKLKTPLFPIGVSDLNKYNYDILKDLTIKELHACARELIKGVTTGSIIPVIDSLKNIDNNLYKHSLNTSIYAAILGLRGGLAQSELNKLVAGSLLHDIGKTKIPEKILNKETTLTSEERAYVETHPTMGAIMLSKNSDIPYNIIAIAEQHHENYDGTGYPNKLKGTDIYELARIVRICDVFDALRSTRPYKDKLSLDVSIGILEMGIGNLYDPYWLAIFIKCIRESEIIKSL